MTTNDLLSTLLTHVRERNQCLMAHLNMHALHVLHREPEMSQLHRSPSTYVFIDGMPIVMLCRLAGVPASREQRITAVDFIWPLLEMADRNGWRVYYVGNAPEVHTEAVRKIRERFPKLELRGHHGFIGDDHSSVVAEISEFRADLVLVGMGTPLQELWSLKNMAAFAPASVVPCGAVMEVVAGVVRTPPRWMGKYGLEWLFRLADNPKRFWRRYLIEPWDVAWTLAGNALSE